MSSVSFKLDPNNPPKLERELAEAQERLTQEEIEAAALSDRDNPPMTDAELAAGVVARRVRHIRKMVGLSQAAFAERYRIPIQTLRHWESGRRRPDRAALAYLDVIAAMPEEVAQALAA